MLLEAKRRAGRALYLSDYKIYMARLGEFAVKESGMEMSEISKEQASLIRELGQFCTSVLSDALDKLGLQGAVVGLRPLVGGVRIAGSAVTVKQVVGELVSSDAQPKAVSMADVINTAGPGQVIVIDNGGLPVSSWGGLTALAAKIRGVEGVIAEAGVRDVEEIQELGFPVFARHITPVASRGRAKVVAVNGAIQCGEVLVRAGDIIVADSTGVIVVPMERAAQILTEAKLIDAADKAREKDLKEGRSFELPRRS